MLPVIEAFKKKYKMEQLIVVADAGLMSDKNIKQLLANNYSFIIWSFPIKFIQGTNLVENRLTNCRFFL